MKTKQYIVCESARPFSIDWAPTLACENGGGEGTRGELVEHVKCTLKAIQPYDWRLVSHGYFLQEISLTGRYRSTVITTFRAYTERCLSLYRCIAT